MRLTDEQYERVLAWASGEAFDDPVQWCPPEGLLQARAVAALWSDVESLSRESSGIEPSGRALARARSIPRHVSHAWPVSSFNAAVDSLTGILNGLESAVARLVHDDRTMPLAVRGEAGQAVHLAWEADDLDVDVVAEPVELDPLTGAVTAWVVRGEVMADTPVAGLEVRVLDTRDQQVIETASLDGFGQFVIEVPSGRWAIRIGSPDQNLHLEPVELA